MSIDLATIVERLQKIEERLMKEESSISNIRGDVKETMNFARSILVMQASEATNNNPGQSSRQSFAKRCNQSLNSTIVSISGQTLLFGMKRKSESIDKSKTYPASAADPIERSVCIDQDESKIPLSSNTHFQQSFPFNPFMRQTRWDRILRSDYFRKGVQSDVDGPASSQSQLAINGIKDTFSATFVIHPMSEFKKQWDTLESIVIIIQFFTLPVLLGFSEFSNGLPYLTILTSIIFFISMCISCRTGIQKNMVTIMDPDSILDSYLKSNNFYLDLITTFPYVFVIDAACPIASNQILNQEIRYICVLNGLRILRLIYGPEPFWYKSFLKKMRMKTKINASTMGIFKVR